MKCKQRHCYNEVPRSPPGMAYCSRACAPFANLGGRDSGSVPATKSFGSEERGAPSQAFSGSAPGAPPDQLKETKTLNIERGKTMPEEVATNRTSTESEKEREITTETKLQPAESSGQPEEWQEGSQTLPAKKNNLNGMQKETQLMDFIAPSPDSSAGSYRSTNLIDSTLVHLHELMKAVGKETSRSQTNPEQMNAVCNVAKQMRDMMLLKLTIVQTARKLEDA